MINTENLFELVYILIDKKKATARELSEHFGVSTRTIYRWIDSLCLAGIPIFSTKGFGGGIEIDGNYSLDKTVLTEDEKVSLAAAANAVSALSGDDASRAAAGKIRSLTKEKTDWLEVDFGSWNPLGAYIRTVFDVAKGAILKKQVLCFDYYSSHGEVGRRFVQPWKIVFRGQAWYLYGWCNQKEEARYFKLSRIQNIRNTRRAADIFEDSLEAKKSKSKDVEREYSERLKKEYRLVTLTVRIPKKELWRIMDDYKIEENQSSSVASDGLTTVTFKIPDEVWLVTYLLSFGSSLEVVAPKSVKLALEEEIKRMYQKVFQ